MKADRAISLPLSRSSSRDLGADESDGNVSHRSSLASFSDWGSARKEKKQKSCSKLRAESMVELPENFDPSIRYGERDGKRVVAAATSARLIEILTETSDPKFRDAFLFTYQSFITSDDFLEGLMGRYDPHHTGDITPEITKKRARVGGVVKAWVDQCFYDFFDNPELKEKLFDFLKEMEKTMANTANSVLKAYQKKEAEESAVSPDGFFKSSPSSAPPPLPFLPPAMGDTYVSPFSPAGDPLILQSDTEWENVSEKELAFQMTLFESELYRKILPNECLSWNKKDKESKALNICEIVKQFNSVSSWVRTCVVKKVKKAPRIEVLKKFIRLMEELRELNNFNGMMEILSGLNGGAVRRLKETFEGLGQEYEERLETIELLLTHRRSYKTYREYLSQVSPPCVPYVGVFLTDLTFILDGNPDFLEGDLINFYKFQKVADIIFNIQIFQSTPYTDFPVDSSLRKFLTNLKSLTENDCYRWSKKIESRSTEEVRAIEMIMEEQKKAQHLLDLIEKEQLLRAKLTKLYSSNTLPPPLPPAPCPPTPLPPFTIGAPLLPPCFAIQALEMDGKEDPLVKRKKDKMVRTRSKKGTKLEKKPTALEGNKGLAGSGYTKLSWSSGLRVNEKASEVTDGGEPGVEGCGNCGTEFAEDAGVMVCRSCTKKFCVSCQKLCSMGMLFCKKDKLHKLVKEVKGEEGVGGAGEAEGEGGSCVNCSKASPEAVKCLSCGFVFCPSCVKLSSLGMLSCSKGKPHRFPLPAGTKSCLSDRGTVSAERGTVRRDRGTISAERGTVRRGSGGEEGDGGSEVGGGGSCVKCSKDSEEDGRCGVCGFLFCPSCVKLARLGLITCAKGQPHQFGGEGSPVLAATGSKKKFERVKSGKGSKLIEKSVKAMGEKKQKVKVEKVKKPKEDKDTKGEDRRPSSSLSSLSKSPSNCDSSASSSSLSYPSPTTSSPPPLQSIPTPLVGAPIPSPLSSPASFSLPAISPPPSPSLSEEIEPPQVEIEIDSAHSCVNCSKASQEAEKCSTCTFYFCPSCIKLAKLGMLTCKKGKMHEFEDGAKDKTCGNCSKVNEEGEVWESKCGVCNEVFCPSCVKLANLGMLTCKKGKMHKFETTGAGGGEQKRAVSCGNCKKQSEVEDAYGCETCSIVVCPSCQKLCAMGMLVCKKGKEHKLKKGWVGEGKEKEKEKKGFGFSKKGKGKN